ncbi:DNA replication protein [Caldibacillus hisashii]|nr:DNA replication protein [Caldifermentibacillus hisashii]MBU5341254.1 DNA replication protein [Caldifermentibacillus hisashii]
MTDACVAFHGLNGDGGRVGAANVPADYHYVTLVNSPARESQAKIYRALEAYVRTFDRQFADRTVERIKSLYLYSEAPGTGKTTSAVAVLNAWLVTHFLGSLQRNRQPLQAPAYFLDVNSWQTDYNEFNRARVPDSIAEPAARRYYSAMERAKQAPFAVLDDIGVRQATEGFRGDLHSVINYRVTNAMPTVYTSNLPIEDMARVFDNRLYDRMRDMCAELKFEGESKRGRR